MIEPTALMSAAEIQSVDWSSVVAGAEKKECHYYASAFLKKAQEAEALNAQSAHAVYRLFAQITSLHLRQESATEPYGPMSPIEGYRSAIIEDFSDEQLRSLEEIVGDIADPELRARVADVLWLRLRNYKIAILAVDAYVQSAACLEDPEHWTQTYKRIERALRLSTTLGKGGKSAFDKVIAHIETVLDRYQAEDPLFLSHKLMELLLEFNQGDSSKYAALAEKAAQIAERNSQWHRARSYWETKAKWCARAAQKDAELSARIKAAETYVSEAATAASALAASVHMQHAVEAYRRMGGQQERTEELYRQLLQYQQKSISEMTSFSTQFDASDAIKRAQNAVSGKTLHEAIIALCLLVRPIRVAELRKQCEERAQKYPLQFLFPSMLLAGDGRVVGRMPDVLTGNEEDREEAFKGYMVRDADIHYSVEAQATIEPARRQLLLEHDVTLSSLTPFVSSNPLIRPGREYLYAEGLRAGFIGDWVMAAHLLIPQFEDSMRYLLQKIGHTTSGMDGEGVQDERGLTTTLYVPESPAVRILVASSIK